MSERTVTVGEATYTLRPFKGYKAIRIGRIVAEVSRKVPDVLDAVASFTRKYETNNAVRITRVQALVVAQFRESTQGISKQVWEESGGVLELPQSPSTGEQVAAVFPMVFEHAEPQIVRLLALISTPDADLRAADDEGDEDAVDELLKRNSKRLLHEGTIDELLSLAIAASEVISEQFADKGGELGKIRTLFGRGTPEAPPQQDESTPAPSKTKRANSSTDSPARTGGRAAKQSIATGGDS